MVVSLSECHGLSVLCYAYLQTVVLNIVQVSMKHDPFDAMYVRVHVGVSSILHSLKVEASIVDQCPFNRSLGSCNADTNAIYIF